MDAFMTLLAGRPWAVYLLLVLAATPWLAAILPRPVPPSGWVPLRKLLDVLAANVGNAANTELGSAAMAPVLSAGAPQALWGVEHALSMFRAGVSVGAGAAAAPAPAADVAAPAVAPAPAIVPAPAGGVIAALLGAVLLVSLAACGATATVGGAAITLPPAPASPDEAVAEAEAGYTAALTLATSYLTLPRCAAGAPTLCSSPAAATLLRTDQRKASDALDAARAALASYDALAAPAATDLARITTALGTVNATVGAFATLSHSLGVK